MRDEACDLDAASNGGTAGRCNADCTLAPYTDDGQIACGEEYDDGVNITPMAAVLRVVGTGHAAGVAWSNRRASSDDGVDDGGYRECPGLSIR